MMHQIEKVFLELLNISTIPRNDKLVSYSVCHSRDDRSYNIIFHTKSGKHFIMKNWINDDDIETSHDDGHLLYPNDVLDFDHLNNEILGFSEIVDPDQKGDVLSELEEYTGKLTELKFFKI